MTYRSHDKANMRDVVTFTLHTFILYSIIYFIMTKFVSH